MSVDGVSLLGAPIAPLSLVFRRKGTLQRLGRVECVQRRGVVAPASIAVCEQERERERVLLLLVGARWSGHGDAVGQHAGGQQRRPGCPRYGAI